MSPILASREPVVIAGGRRLVDGGSGGLLAAHPINVNNNKHAKPRINLGKLIQLRLNPLKSFHNHVDGQLGPCVYLKIGL